MEREREEENEVFHSEASEANQTRYVRLFLFSLLSFKPTKSFTIASSHGSWSSHVFQSWWPSISTLLLAISWKLRLTWQLLLCLQCLMCSELQKESGSWDCCFLYRSLQPTCHFSYLKKSSKPNETNGALFVERLIFFILLFRILSNRKDIVTLGI